MPRGGARPGAGRPKKGDKPAPGAKPADPPPGNTPAATAQHTPLDYMLGVMRDPGADAARRDRMACAAAQYVHPKAGELGKKGEKAEAAKRAGSGKFAPAAPPRLAAVLPIKP